MMNILLYRFEYSLLL